MLVIAAACGDDGPATSMADASSTVGTDGGTSSTGTGTSAVTETVETTWVGTEGAGSQTTTTGAPTTTGGESETSATGTLDPSTTGAPETSETGVPEPSETGSAEPSETGWFESGSDETDGAADACEYAYREGHGDLFVVFDGSLDLAVRAAFGGPAETLVEPERVCVFVPPESYALAEAMGGAPDDGAFAFLGVPAGQPFWYLPQTPREGLPWLGASTEGVPGAVYDRNELEIAIVPLAMPVGGNVSAWSTDTFGEPTPIYSTVTNVLTFPLLVGAHEHFHWAFTVAGTYTLSIVVRAARSGVVESSAPRQLRFVVDP